MPRMSVEELDTLEAELNEQARVLELAYNQAQFNCQIVKSRLADISLLRLASGVCPIPDNLERGVYHLRVARSNFKVEYLPDVDLVYGEWGLLWQWRELYDHWMHSTAQQQFDPQLVQLTDTYVQFIYDGGRILVDVVLERVS